MSKLISRIKNVLLLPRTEWPVIAVEPETVGGIYTRYILILGAIPALAGFIKSSLIGSGAFGVTVKIGVVPALIDALLGYLFGLVGVYVLALIVNALAPTFGGQKNMVQALKAVAYAYTAAWIAGAAILLPWIGLLLMLAGGIYSIYLLYLGLPATMRAPADKAVPYTVVTILCAIVLGIVLGMLVAAISGVTDLGRSAIGDSDIKISSDEGSVTIDPDSALGKLEAMAKKMETAGAKMEKAQESGDAGAQQQALGEMMGSLLGGGENVEALSPEQIKPFVPEQLAGLPRTNYNVERNTALGFQVASGKASYANESGERSVNLEITDMGSARGLAALAGWSLVETESESDTGYERVHRKDGLRVHEQWDGSSGSGSYELIVADRFLVKLQGSGLEMDEIKAAAESLDLSGLAALKESGVKPASQPG